MTKLPPDLDPELIARLSDSGGGELPRRMGIEFLELSAEHSVARMPVEGNRQVVQHQTGGVIAAINARDGDEVKAGDVLIELDGDALRSELGIVEGQWFEILARKGRLSAERDGLLERVSALEQQLAQAADAPPADADSAKLRDQINDLEQTLTALILERDELESRLKELS